MIGRQTAGGIWGQDETELTVVLFRFRLASIKPRLLSLPLKGGGIGRLGRRSEGSDAANSRVTFNELRP